MFTFENVRYIIFLYFEFEDMGKLNKQNNHFKS